MESLYTIESLYRGLNLEPWREFADQGIRTNDAELPEKLGDYYAFKERYRRTGRTTRIIVEAIKHLLDGGTVVYVAHNLDFARYMRSKTLSYLLDLGVDIDRVSKHISCTPKGKSVRHQPGQRQFVDHYVGDIT